MMKIESKPQRQSRNVTKQLLLTFPRKLNTELSENKH